MRAELAGTARAGDGTAATVCRASPSLSASNTALVISSTNSGMPSVRSMMSCRMLAGSALLPATPSIMAAISRSASRLMRECSYMRLSDPWRLKFWSERHDQQHAKACYPVHGPTERFEARGSIQCASSKIISTGLLRASASILCVSASSVLCLRCCGVSSRVG